MSANVRISLSVRSQVKTRVAVAEWDSVNERKVVTVSQLNKLGVCTQTFGAEFPLGFSFE